MSIDFGLKPYEESMRGRRGLRMVLAPGKATGLDWVSGAVIITEAAFGFLEPKIGQFWPAYNNYGHWGATPIPMDVWQRISAAWLESRDKLALSDTVDQFSERRFLFEDAEVDFAKNFKCYKPELLMLIDEIREWVDQTSVAFDHITVLGI